MSAAFAAARERLRARAAEAASAADASRTGTSGAIKPRTLGVRLRFTRMDGIAMAEAAWAAGVKARNEADDLLEQIEDEMVQALEDSDEDSPVSPHLGRLRRAYELLQHEAEHTSTAVEILVGIARSEAR